MPALYAGKSSKLKNTFTRIIMANSKKYQINVEQNKDTWLAQITRQVTSRKKVVTKQQDDFASEAEAQTWAEQTLAEFIKTQQGSNARRGANRKASEDVKTQRSSRRAEKTLAAKIEKAKLDEIAVQNDDANTNDIDQGE